MTCIKGSFSKLSTQEVKRWVQRHEYIYNFFFVIQQSLFILRIANKSNIGYFAIPTPFCDE